ncbi:hypothetical protein [Williamsia muralis]|uniref:hypothetical protein n=1 Tax=Williamsia marianensis TaxID=85044 RepID=UPI00382EB76B
MDENVIESLIRWTDSGAIWRVTSRTATAVTISMCTCDGGEEVQRLQSADPAVLTWLGERRSSGVDDA